MKIKIAPGKTNLRLLLIAALLLPAFSAHAAVDMFLKLDGIKGESKDDKYQDEIDVLAWSEGSVNSSSVSSGKGGVGGKVSFSDLTITKYIDSSSVDLRLRVANGQPIRDATLVVRKAGEQPLEYFIIKLTDVIVTSISAGGSGGEDRLTENVTLNFAKIEWEYVPQNPDGTGGASKKAKWDVQANQPL